MDAETEAQRGKGTSKSPSKKRQKEDELGFRAHDTQPPLWVELPCPYIHTGIEVLTPSIAELVWRQGFTEVIKLK